MTPSLFRRAPRRAIAALLAAVLCAGLTACDGGATADATFANDLTGRFQARFAFAPLADALALSGVAAGLGDGPFTVLAPSETALRYVGSDFSPVLFAEAQREILARVLRHHIVAGRLAPEAFTDGATLTALDGSTLTVRRFGPVVTVNGVTVDVANPIEATNGVAYPITDVLLDNLTAAERVDLSPSLSILDQSFRVTGVSRENAALDRITVLAPLNDGFQALGSSALSLLAVPTNLEIYRRVARSLVLPGDVDLAALAGQTVTTLAGDHLAVTRDVDGVLSVDGIRVLHQEVTADGRVYILGAPVLSTLTVGERMRIRPDLSRFLSALADIDGAIAALADRDGAVTVFAPSDAAYSVRPAALVAELQEPYQASLVRRVTSIHVVVGGYAPEALQPGLLLTAFDGTVLTVDRRDGAIIIDDAVAAEQPLRQANGYLYTTSAFLLPDVDLLDTLVLRNYVGYYRALRRLGLEAEFRARVRTAFVLPDELIGQLLTLPDDVSRVSLRRTATDAFFPKPPRPVLPDHVHGAQRRHADAQPLRLPGHPGRPRLLAVRLRACLDHLRQRR